ncbi:MAG: 30S ribosomal protein S16 [Pirellulales bacterium]|nr:30S ribosomal protein S16 [Pirellulales bacterium]
MSVKLRMKMMGRKHRAYFRICATDTKAPRDGRVIEEVGTYDPSIPLTDARCTLDLERVKYWLGVGAQPSDRVKVLIKKYGPDGSHLKQQEAAVATLKAPKVVPDAGAPAFVPKPKQDAAVEAPPAAASEPGLEAAAPAEASAE